MSLKYYLKVFSVIAGLLIGICSFFQIFALCQAAYLTQERPLLLERLLEIFLTSILFMSSVSLVFGAFVESKKWLIVWALGTLSFLGGYAGWLLHKKYSKIHPESVEEALDFLTFGCCFFIVILTVVIKLFLILLKDERYIRQVCAPRETATGINYTPPKQTYLHSHPTSYILKLGKSLLYCT